MRKLFKWFLTFLLALLLLFAIVSVFMQLKPFDKAMEIKGYKPLVVFGGSMEPAIQVGSALLVKSVNPAGIKTGDIITFKTPRDAKLLDRYPLNLTTHRVIEVLKQNGTLSFKTKGDANDDPDRWLVNSNDVFGKTVFSIPYAGYFINFTKTPKGFLLLIILPAFLIIFGEVKNILGYLKESKESVKEKT